MRGMPPTDPGTTSDVTSDVTSKEHPAMSINHARTHARRHLRQAIGCNQIQAANALHRGTSLQHLVDDGARARDLVEWLDLKPSQAQRAMHSTTPVALPPAGHRAVTVGVPDLAPAIAVVPARDLARLYASQYGLYARDEELRGRIRFSTTHIGVVEEDGWLTVYPITSRYRVGSAAALPAVLGRGHSALAAPGLRACWPAAAAVFQLGTPLQHRIAAHISVRGTRYLLLADFWHAVRTAAPLTALPTCP